LSILLETLSVVRKRIWGIFPIKDSSPKFVLSLDPVDMSRDGIAHLNIIDFFTRKS